MALSATHSASRRLLFLTLVAAAITCAALFGSAIPASAAGPDPATVYLDSLTYSGSGCPQGTVGQSLSSDRTSFTLIFDNFVASQGAAAPITESRKNCQLDLTLHAPAGWAWAMVTSDVRGYVQLDSGVQGTTKTTTYVDGFPAASSQTDFTGPVDKDYIAHSVSPGYALNYSLCGESGRLHMDTEVYLRGGAANAHGQLTVDSFEGKFTGGAGFSVAWKQCTNTQPVSAGPDPNQTYIQSVSYGGTACPQGTVSQQIGGRRTGMTLGFDQAIASSGPGIPITESRKNCQVNFNLHLPPGWAWAIDKFSAHGYLQLAAGDTGTASSTLFFAGQALQTPASFVANGPAITDYTYQFQTPGLEFNQFTCQGGIVPLNLNLQVSLTGAGPSQMTFDALDAVLTQGAGPSGLAIGLVARPCGAPQTLFQGTAHVEFPGSNTPGFDVPAGAIILGAGSLTGLQFNGINFQVDTTAPGWSITTPIKNYLYGNLLAPSSANRIVGPPGVVSRNMNANTKIRVTEYGLNSVLIQVEGTTGIQNFSITFLGEIPPALVLIPV